MGQRGVLLENILRPHGSILISTLITSAIFSLSTCSLPHVAEVLLEFLIVDKQVPPAPLACTFHLIRLLICEANLRIFVFF